MKKAIIGLVVIGAIIALRPAVKQKMHEHCGQMAAKCKQMMATQAKGRGEEARMSEHCGPMATQAEDRGEAVSTV